MITTVHALLLPVGNDVYALDTASVREVVTAPAVTCVPTIAAFMLGMFNLRGEVVPLFDTAALLGVGHLAAVTFVVVVTTSAGPAGLVVSGLPKVVVLDDLVGPSELRATLGMYVHGDGVAVLLDVESLLRTQTGSTEPLDVQGSVR